MPDYPMNKRKNYITDTIKLLIAVIAGLALLSLIPGYSSGKIALKRVNMLSGLMKSHDSTNNLVAEQLALLTADTQPKVPAADSTTTDSVTDAKPPKKKVIISTGTTPIEDFSADGVALSRFFAALDNIDSLGRPVRIAFVGDSFTEGDILTSDIRDLLQTRFGGRGVGFVPVVPAVKYTNTTHQDYNGWQAYSMIYNGKAENNKLLLPGQYFVPGEGATLSLKSTGSKQTCKAWDKVGLLYMNTDSVPATVSFRMNSSADYEFALPENGGLRLLEVEHPDINSLECSFLNADSMVVYGLFLDDGQGVYVDNLSLRSSTGLTLSLTNAALMRKMNSLVKFDLVILQHGLNVAEPDKTAYGAYKTRMVNVISHLKSAMPETDFLIFGISDRNFKNDEGETVTMPGIISMAAAQRDIARETGIAFWNTFLAMGGPNSMASFVESDPPLANKDYTHITYAGGKRLARQFVNSLMEAKENY